MANRVGQQLGNYRLTRLLGRGGFAEVYLGEHLLLKNYAALKVLRTELADKDVATFLAEGQTLARLVHPQIVRVHDFAVEQGTPFLVMDYAPRGTLRRQHPYGSCLSLDKVVTYVNYIAAALQYAHNRNMIHRDVKPENMLLGAQREVLLSDFGLALFAPSPELLSTQEMAGTLPYIAPEQLRGKPCFASDQYALGIAVYEWLCGARPFEGNYWQLLNQHALVLPPPLREKDPSLSEAVESVVLKALAKDPAQRYVSVQLFAQALERASQTGASSQRYNAEMTGPLPAISPIPPVKPRRIFLSSSYADSTFVARLQSDLQERGIIVWNMHYGNTAEIHSPEDLLRQAMRAVDVVVLVVSSHTRSSHIVKEHLRIASLYQRQLVSVWASGEDLAALLPEMGEKTVLLDVIDARETRYAPALDLLVHCLQEETDMPSLGEPVRDEQAHEPRNPYKGLRAFTANDTADFFGRETLIRELVEGVKERLSSEKQGLPPARLLAVIGPSGSGKSSVVMAGLLPRLQQNALPGSDAWVYLQPMVPGTHPLERLALTLAPHLPERSLKSIREDLVDDSARGLLLLATHLVKGSDKKVVLLIDQFEEVFTLTTSQDEREHFFELLLTAITERKGPLLVILTLRADFYDRLMTSAELGRLIQKHQLVVWPMQVDELRMAIQSPAALPDVKMAFEGNLVGDLLYEVRGQAGVLPLLQFTLDQLFKRRKEHMLTEHAYQEIGGVKGALAKHAEETYLALPSPEHRQATRTLFLRLIDPGVTEQDTTRRRTTLTELVFVDQEQTRQMQEAMDVFVQARLLTSNASERVETTIEVSHEALIREWPRLVIWLGEARDDIRLQSVISEDAAAWERNKHSRDRLYRGTQLKEARAWAKRNTTSRQEHTFLRAGMARQLRTFVSVIAMLLLVITVSGIAGWLGLHQSAKADYVTTTDEYAPGSLLWAIGSALPGDTITFAPSMEGQTIVLKNVDIHIFQQNLTIQGPATGHITIRGIGASLIIDKTASVSISALAFQGSSNADAQLIMILDQGKLKLTNCTVSGNTSGGIFNNGTLVMTRSTIFGNTSYSDGAGIANSGNLTVTSSIISGNTAYGSNGGGIANSGNLTVTSSTISGNTSSFGRERNGSGGGIANSGNLTVTSSTISGNTSSSGGAGIANSGNLTVTSSTISGNTSSEKSGILFSSGGGISNDGTLTMMNSTISGNTTTQDGGGISNGGTLTMMNSTIFNNTATQDGGGISNGGTLTMMNSTISGNTATQDGGGIFNGGTTPPGITNATLIFCTIVNNRTSSSDGFDIANRALPSRVYIKASIVGGKDILHNPIAGGITSGGYNVIQNMSPSNFDASLANATDRSVNDLTGIFGSHPLLQKNGGPTQTYQLLPGASNPALDNIPLEACMDSSGLRVLIDQRGRPRPGTQKQLCDSGAYESQR